MFSERLKSLRTEANLTQKEIAQKLNISQPAYAQWETGKLNPKKETIQMFADFFNVSYDYLVGNVNIKRPEDINLSDFEVLYRKTSKEISKEEQIQLEKDLKVFLFERQKIINERNRKRKQ